MKKCPYCNAVIEENARFCIYCMKTLNEKQIIKPQKPIKKTVVISIISAILVFALIVICSFFPNTNNPSFPSINSDSIVNDSNQNFDSSFSENSSENTENNESPYQTSSSNGNSKNNFTSNTITSNNTTTNSSSKSSSGTSHNTASSTTSSSTGSSSSNNSVSSNNSSNSDSFDNSNTSTNSNSSNASSAENVDILQYLTYEIVDNEYFKITDCDENLSGEITIPKTIDNITVTIINHYAFKDCNKLTAVHLPDTITEIRFQAFYNCTSLKTINFPKSLTFFGVSAFENCSSLIEAIIPSVECINDKVFKNCVHLKYVNMGKLDDIRNNAFENCMSLEVVSFTFASSHTIVSIYANAFLGCTSITDVYSDFDKKFVSLYSQGNDYITNATWHKTT